MKRKQYNKDFNFSFRNIRVRSLEDKTFVKITLGAQGRQQKNFQGDNGRNKTEK